MAFPTLTKTRVIASGCSFVSAFQARLRRDCRPLLPMRHAGQIWKRAKEIFVIRPIVLSDHMRVLGTRAAVFHRALERAEGLRPQAVFTAVPEQERESRGRGDRHRPFGGHADSLAKRGAVLEIAFRLVAGAARHLAVSTESRVEEQPLAESCRARIVRDSVRQIGGTGSSSLSENERSS